MKHIVRLLMIHDTAWLVHTEYLRIFDMIHVSYLVKNSHLSGNQTILYHFALASHQIGTVEKIDSTERPIVPSLGHEKMSTKFNRDKL